MNSGGLGLVNAAVNSLLGSMGTNTTGQSTTDNSFNQIFDKKMQYASNNMNRSYDVSESRQVNREKTTATNAGYENDREAYVKSDMQKPKKPIEKTVKEKASILSNDNKLSKKEKIGDAEAIEAKETEVVEEVEVDEEAVMNELMALLNNDQLSDEEKLKALGDWFEGLSETELSVLEKQSASLKDLLLGVNGSLDGFQKSLSELMVDGKSFADVLEASESNEGLSIEGLETVKDSTGDLDGTSIEESISNSETDDVDSIDVLAANKSTADEKVEEGPKETKAERLEAAAEKSERVITGSEVNADTNSSRNTNQQSSDSNQSFAESLKFHTATVKTAAMKNVAASNPFEEKIMQQIIKGTQVSMNVGKDVSEMMIKLNPKDLGNVSLKISLKNDELIAEFNVENKTVKEVLESRLEDLKTALSDKGFNIQGLDVSVNQDANEQFKSYEEFIKQQKGKKKFEAADGVTAIGDDTLEKESQWQTLESTSSEINVLA